MKEQMVIDHIVNWLKNYRIDAKAKGFVVGISGGVDSAVTSTLCALTEFPTIAVRIPIGEEDPLAQEQVEWLKERFLNVKPKTLPLSDVVTRFRGIVEDMSELAYVNLIARIRMAALYTIANTHNVLVVGTGNKVEDFGVGFFTKYGDGGVDISPLAALLKSQVYTLAHHLDILEDITDSAPTDGLWGDYRTDEMQLGATYDELEWAMGIPEDKLVAQFSKRQLEILNIYKKRHYANEHKMKPPPICEIPDEFLK